MAIPATLRSRLPVVLQVLPVRAAEKPPVGYLGQVRRELPTHPAFPYFNEYRTISQPVKLSALDGKRSGRFHKPAKMWRAAGNATAVPAATAINASGTATIIQTMRRSLWDMLRQSQASLRLAPRGCGIYFGLPSAGSCHTGAVAIDRDTGP